MAKKKKWIKAATENSHGQFRAKAERAGESTLAYAHQHDDDGGKLGKEAVLAENLIAAGHHRKPKTSEERARHRYGNK